MKSSATKRRRGVRIVIEMAEIFVGKHVARSAAALSYYITISVFPFLICVSAILGNMHIQRMDIMEFLEELIPANVFSAVSGFFDAATGYSTELIISIGIIALLTSSSAAFRSFIGIMGEIQGKRRFRGAWGGVFSFVFSIVLIVAIFVSGLMILSGEWLMQILESYFSLGDVLVIWTWVRFVILFLLLFGIIYGVYIISAPKETKRTHRLPGALFAAVVLLVASVLYSRLITASIRYAILYGSLASFIILMIWLYTCGMIIIMGNVFNISLRRTKESAEETHEGTGNN